MKKKTEKKETTGEYKGIELRAVFNGYVIEADLEPEK